MQREPRAPRALRHFLGRLARSADDYRVRVMMTSCLTLILLIVLTHTPFELLTPRIGWLTGDGEDRMMLQITDLREADHNDPGEGTPVTDFGLRTEEVPVQDDGPATGTAAEAEMPKTSQPFKVRSREVLNFAEQQPEIVGGISSYYLNIDYPEAAREAGIQGRLLLTFVVEPTGRASNIRIEQSLHPLCDSAAIAALERSRFIAGRQDGKKVPVRMRLPVRFRLIDMTEEPVLTQSQDQ